MKNSYKFIFTALLCCFSTYYSLAQRELISPLEERTENRLIGGDILIDVDGNPISLPIGGDPKDYNCDCYTWNDAVNANLTAASLLEERRRREWFHRQRGVLLNEMQVRTGQTYPSFDAGLRAYLRRFWADKFTSRTDFDNVSNDISAKRKKKNEQRLNHYAERLALTHRRNEINHQPNKETDYGWLQHKGKFLRFMSDRQVKDYLFEANGGYNFSTNDYELNERRVEALRHVRNNNLLQEQIVTDEINYINTMNSEDYVRLLRNYLIAQNLNTSPPQIPREFTPGIYTPNIPNTVSRVVEGRARITPVTQVPFPNMNFNQAFERFTINSLGANAAKYNLKDRELSNRTMKYLRANDISYQSTVDIKQLYDSFGNGTQLSPINALMDLRNFERSQTRTRGNVAMRMYKDDSNAYRLSYILHQLFKNNTNYEYEGYIFRYLFDQVKDRDLSVPSYISNRELGILFNFSANNQGRFHVEIEYVRNIGLIFVELDMELTDFVKYPIVYNTVMANLVRVDGKDKITLQQRNEILKFVKNNQFSTRANTYAQDLLNILINGNQIQKTIVSEMLRAINSNEVFDIAPYINPAIKSTAQGPTAYCPDPPCDNVMTDEELMYEFGPGLIIGAGDALWSSILRSYEWWVSDETEGRFIRRVLEHRGLDLALDIDDETLGELFIVRYENQLLTVLWDNGFGADLLDLGLDALDISTILSPSRGGGAFLAARGAGRIITAGSLKAYLKKLRNIARTTLAGGRGYKSFGAFKRAEGNASPGNALHHIVEQNGFKSLNELKFGKTNIHNTKNIIEIPNGTGELHKKVTGYYNSIDNNIAPGIKVREAIKDWSFQEQYNFGIQVLKRFGWDGITGIFN